MTRERQVTAFVRLLGDGAALVGFGGFLLVAWQVVYELELFSRFAVPSVPDTAEEVWTVVENIASGGFVLDAVLYTLLEIVLGFALALATGLILGIVAGDTRFGQKVLMPYLVVVNVMPRIAFAPVFVAWLGFGLAPKVLMATFIAFFPIVINTALGIRSCTPNSLLLFRSMGAGRWQTLRKLKLPSSLPHIFAGMKTAMVPSVIGAIVAEFLGGSAEGVGELIRRPSSSRSTRCSRSSSCSARSAWSCTACWSRFERWVVRWKADAPQGAGA